MESLREEAPASETEHMFSDRHSAYRCCCCFPRVHLSPSSWWRRGAAALMKVREWSELAAGPRWKTFLRRFNRNGGNPRMPSFRYDPLSYALNFDEGPNEDDDDQAVMRRGLSARFVAPPAPAPADPAT